MASQDEFKQVMRDIYKHAPLIGLEDQGLLQSWVKRLAAAGSEPGKAQDLPRALDYARFLAYQLQRKQLRFPFAKPPAQGSLPDLKEVLFGPQSADAADLNTSCHVAGFERALAPTQRDTSLNTSAFSPGTWAGDSSWDSHDRSGGQLSHWDSHIADPKGERDVAVHLEELAEDAPLWLLLARVCAHTRDGGNLMQAVVAEELAEWSARLAAEQTVASRGVQGQPQDDDEDEEEEDWGARADRRADYWQEVIEAIQSLGADDPGAKDQLLADIDNWLAQENRQLQAEQAQLQALTDVLQEVRRQIAQTQKWRETQFEVQNRVLQAEVEALKQSITDKSQELEAPKISSRAPKPTTTSGAQRRLSISSDSLDTSRQKNSSQ